MLATPRMRLLGFLPTTTSSCGWPLRHEDALTRPGSRVGQGATPPESSAISLEPADRNVNKVSGECRFFRLNEIAAWSESTLVADESMDSAKCVAPLQLRLSVMNLPDLAPWLDSVSDEYDELPSGDHAAPYDE